MKTSTREWVHLAEDDFQVACTLIETRRKVGPNSICFHCQQSIEKHLKARLAEADIYFPKTHDLKLLLNLSLAVEPLWEAFRTKFDLLNEFAVTIRYPGQTALRRDAVAAFKISRSFRQDARLALCLPPR